MAIAIEKSGARVYLVGDTYAVKDRIKSLGGHWDGDRKAWWIGATKEAAVKELVAGLTSNGSAQVAERSGVSDNSKVVGKCQYKSKSYYILWMGRCGNGAEKAHLTVLDGSIDFWADLSACQITKRYQPREYRGRTEYTTLGSIRKFIERQREGERTGNICCECGKAGELVRDLEDGGMKHRHCCDIEP